MLVVLVQLQQLYDLCRTPLGWCAILLLCGISASLILNRVRMRMSSSGVPLQQDWPLQHSMVCLCILESSLFGVELVSVTSVSVLMNTPFTACNAVDLCCLNIALFRAGNTHLVSDRSKEADDT